MTTLDDTRAVAQVDHELVQALRAEVAEHLAADPGQVALTAPAREQLARSLTLAVLERRAGEDIAAGRPARSAADEQALVAAVVAALFAAGRLQPLLDNELIENIDINGHDCVFVSYADGRRERVAPIATSDAELIALVQQLGSDAGLSSRAFDTAHPELDVRLPDGSRLAAVRDIARVPAVSIRRHRLHRVHLHHLVELGTIDDVLAEFLRALVASRANVMIAGATGAGKTTLLRAIANEIPPEERLITVERTLELGLDHLADLHPDALALEERPPNGEGQGAVTMSQLVQRTLRMSPGRVVVGEVLGSEVVAMLNAMMQGNTGSLSTIHARAAEDVFLRVATYAIQSRERLDERASAMLFHAAIDFVVYIERVRGGDGRSKRVVTSIREITGVDDSRVQSSEVFGGAPPGQPAQPRYAVSTRRAAEFRAIGYEPPSATGWMG